MPHAVEDDEDDIQALLQGANIDRVMQEIGSRDLEYGEKANDAEDYEDIGDDDLIEEEAAPAASNNKPNGHLDEEQNDNLDSLFTGADDPFDDLFNARDQGSPDPDGEDTQETIGAGGDRIVDVPQLDVDTSLGSTATLGGSFPQEVNKPQDEVSDDDEDVREQRDLFAQAQREREERLRRGDDALGLPPAPQTNAELFSVIWPQFEHDKPPRFSELLPGKRAHYLSKTPIRPPKPVQPTKVVLELEQDQEKSFRLPGTASVPFAIRQAEAAAQGIILTADEDTLEEDVEDDENMSVDSGDPSDVGNYKWQDLVAICQDWSIPSPPSSTHGDDPVQAGKTGQADDDDIFMTLEDADETPSSSSLKRKRAEERPRPLQVLHDLNTSYEDPEAITARLAKKVRLDLNDSEMLIDTRVTSPRRDRKHLLHGSLARGAGDAAKSINRRYNISNDEAYDLLKENRQSKIRSTLGSLALEHAAPAVRLQHPYYKVKLDDRETRSFHRPALVPEAGLAHFERPKYLKRKLLKSLDPQEVFVRTEDLSHGDNSHALLLEYSEEYPAMLSNFGMSNRLINYHRRTDDADTTRPKNPLGETEMLLAQDKSPFAMFGNVEPGETTPAIQNVMFRAPIFKHESKPVDFLLSTSHTKVKGRKWYLKAVENLHVVGQQFPSVEVPGTHSRKVTDASKKRLKMLSYRILRRRRRLYNQDIVHHNPGSDIAQNRSKMRDFMDYDKDKGWLAKGGEVPDEATIRSWIKPEEICLLESMQVGNRQLKDAGYNKDEENVDDADEADGPSKSLDQQLAPWQTTKNFINATQGKAMLELHGPGDPTGRGEAFSFIRTSMKGGFKQVGESVEDRLNARNRKELGGHTYNVANQQQKYNQEIKRIWNKQKDSLSSVVENDLDNDDDEDHIEDTSFSRGRTPSSVMPGGIRNDTETGSMFSHASHASDAGNVLRITRTTIDKYGQPQETEEIVRDHRIIREYRKRRKALHVAGLSIGELVRTGDEDQDATRREKLETELARLQKNKERKAARDRLKGVTSAASPKATSPAAAEGGDETTPKKGKHQAGATLRKCANCGQVGHIKTNKKSVHHICNVCLYMKSSVG